MNSKILLPALLILVFLIGCTDQGNTQSVIDNTQTKLTDNSSGSQTLEIKNENLNIDTSIGIKSDCTTAECFQQNFKECKPSSLELTISDISLYYEILGPKDNKCEVLTRFNKNPDETLVGKEMTCLLDTSLAFDQQNSDPKKVPCEGELYDLLITQKSE